MRRFWYYYSTWFLPIMNGIFLILLSLTFVGPWADYQVQIGKTTSVQRCPVWMGWTLDKCGIVETKNADSK